MRKHMKQKNYGSGISIQQTHQGCMWGILHVLKHQHWHWRFIKKRLPHRWHDHSGAENSGDDVQASNADDSSKYKKAEVANSKVEGKKRPSSPTTKHSVRSRLRSLISEEMSKRRGRGRHHRSSTYPAQSQLRQEPGMADDLREIDLNDEIPEVADENNEISSDSSSEDQNLPNSSEEPVTSDESDEECGIMLSGNDSSHDQLDESEKQLLENSIFSRKRKDFLKRKSITSKDLTKNASESQSKYLMDAMDIINMNKGFLLTILQDPGSPLANHFHEQLARSGKMRITKFGSFPSPGSSSRKGSAPRRQNQKQYGTEFDANKKESDVCFHGKNSPDHESTEDICKKSMPVIAADHRADGIYELNQSKAELADISHSDGNKVAKKRFKHLKQNIKHAIKESKKERYRIAMDAVLHKIPHKKGFSKDLSKDILDNFKDTSRIRGFFTASSIRKRRIQLDKRSSSLDRYTQLYESSFNKETKDHISKRIQERKEEGMVLPRTSAPKSLGRILSSPDLYSYFYLSEDSDAFSSDMPATVADSALSIGSLTEQNILDVSEALDYCSQLDTLGKDDQSEENLLDLRKTHPVSSDQLASNSYINSKTIAQVGKTSDEFGNLMIGDNVSQSEQESKPEMLPIMKLEEQSSPFLEFNLEGQIVSPEISKSQDSWLEADFELMQSEGFPSELGLLADMQQELRDTPKVAEDIVEFDKVEALKKDLESDFWKEGIETSDKHKFTYVRNVLELSGYSGNETLGTWQVDDQPLDPLVYKEVKGCIFCDPQCSRDEEVLGYCNHPLLFDLINEVLIDLYERSYSYCPRPLSYLCHIRPLPVGHHVLKDVWTNISWYLSYESGFDKPLDYVASRDLKRDDGWMNLQFENECLGLELEESIFNDLLEELFYA